MIYDHASPNRLPGGAAVHSQVLRSTMRRFAPGARSILSFAKPLDADASNIMLTLEGESRALAEFAVLFRVVLGDIMAAGFNTGILILRTLNALPATEVHTRFLESIPFNPLAAWDTIESLLNV